MISTNSKKGISIRLTDERIAHILRNHPEMKDCISWILETIEGPDFISAGDFGELMAIKLYPKSPVTIDKYLIAVYKEISEVDGSF